ncbi:MAG: TlpA family protein disulfide reductase [Candidatus Heimdallarchaeota archaeon]
MQKRLFWSLILVLALFALTNALASPLTQTTVPDFSLRNIRTNAQTSLNSFRGKVVLIDFFATWCKPCEITIPVLKDVDAAFGSNFQLLSVDVQWNGGESDETVLTFIEEEGMSWLVLKDTYDSSTAAAYGVTAIPTFFLIDKNGDLRQTHQGATITSAGLTSEISTLLQEEQSPPGDNGSPQAPSSDPARTKTAEKDDSEGIPPRILFAGFLLGALGVGAIGVVIGRRPRETSSPEELERSMETQHAKERAVLKDILGRLEKSPGHSKKTNSQGPQRATRRGRRRR